MFGNSKLSKLEQQPKEMKNRKKSEPFQLLVVLLVKVIPAEKHYLQPVGELILHSVQIYIMSTQAQMYTKISPAILEQTNVEFLPVKTVFSSKKDN